MKIYCFLILSLIFYNTNIAGREILITSIDSTFKGRLLINPDYTYISCSDSLNCAAVISNFFDNITKLRCVVFYQTTNGGKNWTCVSMDCSCWRYYDSINDYKYYQITNTNVFFYNKKKEEIVRSFNNGQVGRSKNWGKTWFLEKDSIFNNYEFESLLLILLDNNKVIGYNPEPIWKKETGYARIFISDEDFKNWKNIPLPDSLNVQTIYSIYNFNGKFFLLNESLKEHYFYFYFTKTEDNGKNWSTYKLELDSGKIHTSTMFFLNDTTGWIIGNYTENGKNKISVFFTNNGGHSWDIISDFFSVDIYKRLFFNNKNEGVMFSSNIGFITNDGGKTWEKLTYKEQRFPYPISRIVLLKRNEFICITYDGIIFKLTIPEE